ncbi:MAG: UDP-2,4-diacetamido-2,4,6-trideoxy-beta-L-altropyranose hydrolase [Gammaproteobacteria bacterium]|nr:UDP-2,4-diacetamido-2,4,6-trideoxy-beta-L-altropyranose hydrolase [Gammaproteobacteria bacterium]
MRVAFRVDASTTIGTGHVMRCLVLADELRRRGVATLFVCRNHHGNLGERIQERGHGIELLTASTAPVNGPEQEMPPHAAWLGVSWEQDCAETEHVLCAYGKWDWLVVDHYALDARWESHMKTLTRCVFVIDDLADRPHECNLLLDQSYCGEYQDRYRELVPAHCQCLVGVSHVLLRPEFVEARRMMARRHDAVQRIMVNFGGVDQPGATEKALRVVRHVVPDSVAVDVIAGSLNPRLKQIKALCDSGDNIRLHIDCQQMAVLMCQADLAIGCGGVTALERAYLGLVSLVTSNAVNQDQAVADMAQRGMIIPYRDEVDLGRQLKTILASTLPTVVDAVNNGTNQIVDLMMNKSKCGMRPPQSSDGVVHA